MPPMPSTSFILLVLFCFFGCVISAFCLDRCIKPEKKKSGTACSILFAAFFALLISLVSSYSDKEENRGRFLPFSRLADGQYEIANDSFFNGFLVRIDGDIKWISNLPCSSCDDDFRNLPDGTIIEKKGTGIKIINKK